MAQFPGPNNTDNPNPSNPFNFNTDPSDSYNHPPTSSGPPPHPHQPNMDNFPDQDWDNVNDLFINPADFTTFIHLHPSQFPLTDTLNFSDIHNFPPGTTSFLNFSPPMPSNILPPPSLLPIENYNPAPGTLSITDYPRLSILDPSSSNPPLTISDHPVINLPSTSSQITSSTSPYSKATLPSTSTGLSTGLAPGTTNGTTTNPTPAPSAPPDSQRRVKRRASKACQCCRARKVRCNVTEHGAPCTNCRLDQVLCVVAESRRKKKKNCDGTPASTSTPSGSSSTGPTVIPSQDALLASDITSFGDPANSRYLHNHSFAYQYPYTAVNGLFMPTPVQQTSSDVPDVASSDVAPPSSFDPFSLPAQLPTSTSASTSTPLSATTSTSSTSANDPPQPSNSSSSSPDPAQTVKTPTICKSEAVL